MLCILLYSSTKAQDDKLNKKSFDSTVFADDDTLTRSDYLQGIEKMFKVLNKAPGIGQALPAIEHITQRMNEDDSALAIIRERIAATDRVPNIRNLQMFNTLLDQLTVDTKAYIAELNGYDNRLDDLKKEIVQLRRDSVIKRLFRDPKMWVGFYTQLAQLRVKWKNADSLVKLVNVRIDNTLARTSSNIIVIEELQRQTIDLLKSTGAKAFGKERRYIWEPRKNPANAAVVRSFQKSLEDEQKIAQFYFEHTRNQLYMLIFTGIVFFAWVFYNFKSLKQIQKLTALDDFGFSYINSFPILATLLLLLNLAPLYDLNAPAIYIETIQLLLMLVLTLLFRKLKPRSLFVFWLLFVVLFLLEAFTRLLGIPFYLQRWWTLGLNAASFILGVVGIIWFRKHIYQNKIVFMAGGLYILFNLLATLCNMYGRTTLTQIFGATAIYTFADSVGLLLFIQVFKESLLLQIQGSRMRKRYPIHFDFVVIAKGIERMAAYLAVVIWLVVFTTNLNIYTPLEKLATEILIKKHAIGNFSLSVSGILQFLVIIWTANFLQKYIAYFFGDVGDEAAFDNKGQRSKLMITRLILLTVGFLLAVAASGLELTQITIILGALGVGIGLGLQSIVNNFVSGIILIFDRPLRIGDTVEIGDQKGRVREISVRSSTLLTAEGAEVIIPNGDILSKNIVNWTFSNSYVRVAFSFAIDKMVLSEDIRAAIKEIIYNNPDVLANKEPDILIDTINATSTELKIYFWCKDVVKADRTRSNIYGEIYKRLGEMGVKVL
jgi:small-conductance mechanosensitive channel